MIIRKDSTGAIINNQEGINSNKSDSAKDSVRSGSSFEKMLSESIKQTGANEIHFKKDLLSNPFPEPAFTKFQDFDHKSSFDKILPTVLKHEGSAFVYKDTGRESSKFGILQSTAREYGYRGNVKYMSQPEAEAIYKKIWDRSGAESLPYPMSLIYFDTYVNSPSAAKRLLKKTGDNPEKYLELRAQRYNRLAALRPERYARYLNGWLNRVNNLKNIAAEYALAKNLENNSSVNTEDKMRLS